MGKVVGLIMRAYAAFRRWVPASSARQLLRQWNREYGKALDPLTIGPDWSKKIAPGDRRSAKAGQCPFAAAKATLQKADSL